MESAEETGHGDRRELYEALLDAVRRFCLDHGTALVRAGAPVRIVVTTGSALLVGPDQEDDFVDAVAHVARHNLPGIVEVLLRFLPDRGLPPDAFRIRFPRPAGPGPEPASHPVSPPTLAATTQPLVEPDPPGWAEAAVPLPPVPHLGDAEAAPRASDVQQTIRFTYDTGGPVTQPTWMFTLRPAPEWVPLGRDLGQPGLELSTLGAIPRGRLLFLCVRESSVHLLRAPLREEYQVALGDLALRHRQIVVLPRSGALKWTHRSRPGTSVVRYELREKVIR